MKFLNKCEGRPLFGRGPAAVLEKLVTQVLSFLLFDLTPYCFAEFLYRRRCP